MPRFTELVAAGAIGAIVPIVGAAYFAGGISNSFSTLENQMSSEVVPTLQRVDTLARQQAGLAKSVADALELNGQSIGTLDVRLTQLESSDSVPGLIARLEKVEVVLSDAVIAFQETGSRLCPEDWSVFQEAAGRFLVGAGKGDGLRHREPGETGGEEQVALLRINVPAPPVLLDEAKDAPVKVPAAANWEPERLKTFTDSTTSKDGFSLRFGATETFKDHNDTDGREPQGSPHNNMPPYIALYFCKKD